MALDLYFVTVWPSASECTFFKYPSSWSERIKRFKMAAIIRFDLDVLKMTYKVVAVQMQLLLCLQNVIHHFSLIRVYICGSNSPNRPIIELF